METPTSEQSPSPGTQRTLRVIYWIAAAVMAVSAVLALRGEPDYLAVGSRVALGVALVLLATARPAETRSKKTLIYAFVAVALGLLLAGLFGS